MKKLLLSLSLCFVALVSMAQNVFNEDINVTLKQEKDGQMVEVPLPTAPGKIEVTKNDDGTCDFLMRNFIITSEDGEIPVGNIRLKAVKMTEAEGKIAIETKQTILLENGDAIDGIFWLGPMLGEVPIDLKGSMTDKHMNAVIDINLATMNLIVNVVIGNVPKVYDEDINVSLKQEQEGQMVEVPLPTAPGKIEVSHNDDGTCDFLLRNFSLSMDGAVLTVGNIRLKGVKMSEGADGKKAIETKQTIVIEEGDEPEDAFWLGPMLGEVPIDLKGSMDNEHMNAVIDIDLRKTMEFSVYVVIGKNTETGITEATVVGVQSKKGVYNLNGIRVADKLNDSLPAGVYIADGKKVLVR